MTQTNIRFFTRERIIDDKSLVAFSYVLDDRYP